MVTNYYTLLALADAWHYDLVGCRVVDAYSQVRDELTLALEGPSAAWTLRFSVQGGFHYAFRSEGFNKARRNVATLFEETAGRAVTAVRLADRDRVLYLDLDGGLSLQAHLFGSRANIFLTDAGGMILEAFQGDAEWSGRPAPAPRAAPRVDTFEAFEARWRTNRKTTAHAVASAFPLLDQTLAAEVVHRSGVACAEPAACAEDQRRALFAAGIALEASLAQPDPVLYWKGRFAEVAALVPMAHLAADHTREAFGAVDAAVSVYVRRTLAQRHFRRLYAPLEKALTEAATHYARSAERMLDELAGESRADRYEQWGHLLMASAAGQPAGAEAITLPDLFGSQEPVAIPLDPALTAMENAQRYYDRARRTRRSREEAEHRLDATQARADAAAALLEELQAHETVRDLERWQKDVADRLAPFLRAEAAADDRVPFRRYDLGGGYEVWVGRNAKQNDQLTFRYAQKYDLWMHARGVPGSHAVLRLPHRQAEPGKQVLERAASIAAYHSKAQGSALAPVIVAERKYVRKPRGGAPGAVLVEREQVLLVPPGLPNH